MKMDMNVLGKHKVQSTTGTKKMRMSEHATSMVFQLFTKNVYSDPIGTVVREITSNCFDSHVEAGVNKPVLIKKTYDEQTDSYYISFIDYGVGMSPDRVENVYSVYFESTKRGNDNEIGGFGIGGKTPLAYKRSTGEGEGEYDNSFFVITNYNGTKYYYNVYEGVESPEFTCFHDEPTKEGNGTEIRIPILQRDISKFEDALKMQLYYFENVVFEGFSDNVKNDIKL
jgi:DNA topoisomerase VI subunit B